MTASKEIVLVRHGETAWSRAGLHTGRTDVPLTELGRREADRLAAVLRGRTFVLAMTSPLQRARETCERAALPLAAEVSDDLLERDYGDQEGRTTAQARVECPGWSVWTDPLGGGETVDEVGRRADSVIERATDVDGDVVLFSHGHFLRILAARWIGLPADSGSRLALDTATVSTLGLERENRVIRRWNEGCHLVGSEPAP